MAYPTGMTTCVATAGVPIDFAGEDCDIELVLTPYLGGNARAITWQATGQPVVSADLSNTGTGGQPAQVTVPHVDQPGVINGAGDAFTMWSYTAKRTVIRKVNGRTVERIPLTPKKFQPVQGQTSVDIDLIPDGSITSPTSAPIPAVTSVNGQTGAVTVEGATDAGVAGYVTAGGETTAALDGAYAGITAARPGNWAVFLGDSITYRGAQTPDIGWRGSGFATYAPIISGQRIRYVRNAGVSGDTTAKMLARFDTDVTPYAPNLVVLLAGTNDTGQSVAIATIQANIRSLVAKVRGIGATPVLCTIPPNGTGSPADRKARVSALNAWLRHYAGTEGLLLTDFYSLLVDPATGDYQAQYDLGDHTHPNPAGDYAMGKLLSDTITPLLPTHYPPLPADANDPNNFMRNALFLTDADANGVPDGWTNQSGITGQAVSLVTDPAIKGAWFKFTATGSSGLSILYQSASTSQAGAGVVAGNRYALIGRVKSSALSSGQYAVAQLRFTGGITTDFRAMDQLTQPVQPGGVFHVECVAPAGSTSVQAQIQLSAGTGDLQVAQIGVYDLTAMGATA